MDSFGVLAPEFPGSQQSNSKGSPGDDLFSFLLLLPIISVVRLQKTR